MKKELRILFIGNSHTYFHDLPYLVRQIAAGDGFDVQVTMIAHGGWYLKQHTQEPDVPFNIRYGNYDYVVLQEHSHPFDRLEDYDEAASILTGWIREAGSRPVIYATWSRKVEPEVQEVMDRFNRGIVEKTGALYAPVGEHWWDYQKANPDIEMYEGDGAHASLQGSTFAAGIIWKTIKADLQG